MQVLTQIARRITPEGVARVLATTLNVWPGTATELAEEFADWPLTMKVTKREDRRLSRRDAGRLDASENAPCHWRKGQTVIDVGGERRRQLLVVADTQSTLLTSRLPREVVKGLAGCMPLGTLLEPYGPLRADTIALAVREVNERGEPVAVTSSAVVALETDEGFTRVAIASECWTLAFCEWVSLTNPRLGRAQCGAVPLRGKGGS